MLVKTKMRTHLGGVHYNSGHKVEENVITVRALGKRVTKGNF